MARILKYSELKTPGTGWLELLDCEYPLTDVKPIACAWINEEALLVDLSLFYHLDPDDLRHGIICKEECDYNQISRNTTMAWRVWDSEPTMDEMLGVEWVESFRAFQPSLYFRDEFSPSNGIL